jgi:hypothetical protein
VNEDDPLEHASDVLRADGGWQLLRAPLGDAADALVAESPSAVVAMVKGQDWPTLEPLMRSAQEALATSTAAHDRSGRRWDLYVLGLLASQPRDDAQRLAIDRLEEDTLLARKLVRWDSAERTAVDEGLRPFVALPIQSLQRVTDPLEALRDELLRRGFQGKVIDMAIQGFRDDGEVRLP